MLFNIEVMQFQESRKTDLPSALFLIVFDSQSSVPEVLASILGKFKGK